MKESGIEWIGEIPQNWELVKMKYLGTFDSSGVDKKIYEGQSLYKSIHYTDVYKNSLSEIGDSENYLVISADDNKAQRCMLKKGDVLFTNSSETPDDMGHSTVIKEDINVLFGYHLMRFRPNNKLYLSYEKYTFGAFYMRKRFELFSNGITRFGITASGFENALVVVPSYHEQKQISKFLDEKCNEIDSIIENTKKTIEEYKKYKQSVITEAVTKGLNPNVEMKDSGVEWIGKIPNDWGIEPFKRILHERTEKNLPVKTDERLSLSIDKGVTLYSDKTTNIDRYKEDVSQYKLAYKGDLVLNSMNMIVGAVGVSDYFGCVSPAYYTYFDTIDEHYTARYCDYAFRCKTMRKMLFCLGRGIMAIERGDDRVNTCRLKVSREDLRNLKFPLPNLEEQKEIVQYLDIKCSEIDELIAKKGQLLIELEIYKKSLIHECVTGKLEV